MRGFVVMMAAVAIFGLAGVPAAKAEEAAKQPQVELQIQSDNQMENASEAYKAAMENLSAEQKKELEDLEREFAATMAPDMEIFSKAGELEHCNTTDADFQAKSETYQKAFMTWRDSVNADQEKLWSAHQTLRKKITYVDQAVLDDYYLFQKKLMVQLMALVTMQAQKQGAFAKADCKALAAALDAVPLSVEAQ